MQFPTLLPPAFTAGLLFLTALCVPGLGDEPPGTVPVESAAGQPLPSPSADKAPGLGEPRMVEARFTDRSTLKLELRDEALKVVSPYGTLTIPMAEVCRVDFATRISDEDAREIDAAIARLGSQKSTDRDAATAELLTYRHRAYLPLLRTAEHKDREIARRAEAILKKLRESVPAEDLEVRPHDVVHTSHSKIAGKIEGDVLKARTAQFGEVEMKLADLRSLSVRPAAPPVNANDILPDPGSMSGYNNQIGGSFVFKVTGAQNGSVYGTDVYTTDSNLATAAVHAGVLLPGQAGLVRVNVVPSPAQFTASTRNGITSYNWGVYPAAYEVKPLDGSDDDPGCGAAPMAPVPAAGTAPMPVPGNPFAPAAAQDERVFELELTR